MTNSKNRGFTLVELIIVLALLGIMSALIIPNFVSASNNFDLTEDKDNINIINTALKFDQKLFGVPETVDEMLDVIRDREKNPRAVLVPVTDGVSYYWSRENNKAYIVSDEDGSVLYPEPEDGRLIADLILIQYSDENGGDTSDPASDESQDEESDDIRVPLDTSNPAGNENETVIVYSEAGFDYSVYSDGNYMAYAYGGNETAVRIPDTVNGVPVTALGNRLFENRTAITHIELPQQLKVIGISAFRNCVSLRSVALPEGLESIGRYAFYGCTSLTSVTLPSTLEGTGFYSFSGCTGLSELIIANGVESVDVGSFQGCVSINRVCLPQSISDIEEYSFSGCGGLATVYVMSNSPVFGENVFRGCDSLTRFIVSASALAEVTADVPFDRTVTVLAGACPLTIVYTAGGNRVTEYMPVGDAVWIPYTEQNGSGMVVAVSDGVFRNANIRFAFIPECVETIGDNAFNGCIYLSELLLYDGLTEIGESAFFGCESLATLTLPQTLTEIKAYAFAGCTSIASLTVPANTESIGESAFAGCSSLASVEFLSPLPPLIDADVFSGCDSALVITVPAGCRDAYVNAMPQYEQNIVEAINE